MKYSINEKIEIGVKIGKLRIRHPDGKKKWVCLCDCGKYCYATTEELSKGKINSCGCVKIDLTKKPKGSYFKRKRKENKKVRKSDEYKTWRKKIYKRDNHLCQTCKDINKKNLHAHHIYSFNNNPTLRLDVDNGITMCIECHKDFHKKYGNGNNTKRQLFEYYESKQIKTVLRKHTSTNTSI